MGWADCMSADQWKWWNEGLDHHPLPLEDCPYEVGTDAYSHFEDGWWFADNE